MSTVIFWFRSDLRLHDQPALAAAIQGATHLLPVVCGLADEPTPWGFSRVGPHRRAFFAATVRDLSQRLAALGSRLQVCDAPPAIALPALARAAGATTVVCEAIAAPYEEAEVAALRAAGLEVRTVWQSTLFSPDALPFSPDRLPQVFTAFRQALERARRKPTAPIPAPRALPPPPPGLPPSSPLVSPDVRVDPRSSFPYGTPECGGGETAALAHLAQYLARKLPHTYKATRNGLMGRDYSSKLSPWLATGALSVRQVFAELRRFEDTEGANDGTYWLFFELLWRDYFRFLHLQHGRALYRARGLSTRPPPTHDPDGFARWCSGRTGEPLVDAAMRELLATGYLSNRLRQVAASYLIHDAGGDWRAGAAFFEAQLVDFDVYSNQGNWLYIAGRGTDPRGGRRFNPEMQAQDYNADGHYRRLWSTP